MDLVYYVFTAAPINKSRPISDKLCNIRPKNDRRLFSTIGANKNIVE